MNHSCWSTPPILGTFSSRWQMAGLPDGKEGRDLLGQTCKLWHPGGSLDTDFALDFAAFLFPWEYVILSPRSQNVPQTCVDYLRTFSPWEFSLLLGCKAGLILGVWPWFCWVKHRGIWVGSTSTVTASPSIKWPKFGAWDSWAVTFFLNLVVHVSIHQPFPKLQNHVPSSGFSAEIPLTVGLQVEAFFSFPWSIRNLVIVYPCLPSKLT